MELLLLSEVYAICRMGPTAQAPSWGVGEGLWSLTRTSDELSLVCVEGGLPVDTGAAVVSRGWRALRVVGTLDFSMIGVLAGLSVPLAAASVAIFVMSTYDTDYLMVRADDLEKAQASLELAGYRLRAA